MLHLVHPRRASYPVNLTCSYIRYELFDMATDPYELHNIYANASAAQKQTLHTLLRQWYECRGPSCL